MRLLWSLALENRDTRKRSMTSGMRRIYRTLYVLAHNIQNQYNIPSMISLASIDNINYVHTICP